MANLLHNMAKSRGKTGTAISLALSYGKAIGATVAIDRPAQPGASPIRGYCDFFSIVYTVFVPRSMSLSITVMVFPPGNTVMRSL